MVPLSALLFVLSVEIMALRFQNDKNIKGFQAKIDDINHTIRISQLANVVQNIIFQRKNCDIIGIK